MHLADHANLRDGGTLRRWLGPDQTGRIRGWIKMTLTIVAYVLIALAIADIVRSEFMRCDPCEFIL